MGYRGEVQRGVYGAVVRLTLVLCLMAAQVLGGFSLTVENDFFTGSDDSYTHGTELAWFHSVTNGMEFEGIRSRIYTPKDITVSENQPGDRPWCGVTTVFWERGLENGLERFKYGVEAGVLGPSSMADEQQTWFHELIGDDEPMGWANQLKDEPVVNGYVDVWYELLRFGRSESWSAALDALYGGVAGTVKVDAYAGVGVRAGWNVPPFWPGGIDPKGVRSEWFAYGLAECKGMWVIHNATLGHSMFHRYDGDHSVETEPFVGETKYGICSGWRYFSLTYLLAWRTEEFEGQGEPTEWGEVRLMFGRQF